MCYQTKCGKCGKITWGGCGRHIESALRGVPEEQRCHCREANGSASAAGGAKPDEGAKRSH
ncbi:Metallothionein [Balamuthia mandrillaris]